MSDEKQAHVESRDCWCNPHILSVGSKILTEHAGTVVLTHPIGLAEVAIHIEPHPATLKDKGST